MCTLWASIPTIGVLVAEVHRARYVTGPAVEELFIEAFIRWILTKRAVRLGEVVGQQKIPPLAAGTSRQLRHQACPGLMNKTAREGLRQSRATHGNVILQIERGRTAGGTSPMPPSIRDTW
jgi:hypothetical protein